MQRLWLHYYTGNYRYCACADVDIIRPVFTYVMLFPITCVESNKVEIVRQGAAIPLIQLARHANSRAQRNASGSLLNLTHVGELLAQCMECVQFSDHNDHIP